MLYLIGLGLGSEKDITVQGLEYVRKSQKVYLEFYTSVLGSPKDKLEAFYGKEIILADREFVESGCEEMLQDSLTQDIAFLVVGDPFGATTHMDIWLRAKNIGVQVKVVHNASIMNAVAACGLQLYNFGQTVSIPFFTDSWKPDSFYDKIAVNSKAGLHTLCLLDIKVKEQTTENLLRGNKIFEPPRFMSINQCIEQLLEVESTKNENVYNNDTPCIGLARVGQETQTIISGTLKQLETVDFGGPLHSFVIPGTMHIIEQECFDHFKLK